MIIDRSLIKLDLAAANQDEAIRMLAEAAFAAGRIGNLNEFCSKVKAREAVASTDMGFGIAVPHGKTDCVKDAFVVFGRLQNPIVWNQEAGSEINMIFMLGSPETSESNIHLVILAQLARHLMDEDYLEAMKTAETEEELLHYFDFTEKGE